MDEEDKAAIAAWKWTTCFCVLSQTKDFRNKGARERPAKSPEKLPAC